MTIQANSMIHSCEQIDKKGLKHFRHSYVIKNIRRTNLTSKRGFLSQNRV